MVSVSMNNIDNGLERWFDVRGLGISEESGGGRRRGVLYSSEESE